MDSIDDDQDEGPSSNSNIADQRAGLMAPRVLQQPEELGWEQQIAVVAVGLVEVN